MADRMFAGESDLGGGRPGTATRDAGPRNGGPLPGATGPAPDGIEAALPVLRRLGERVERNMRLLDRLRADPLAAAPPGLSDLIDIARRLRHDTDSLLMLVGEDAGLRRGGPRTLDAVLDEAVDATAEPMRVDVRSGPGASIQPAAATELLHVVAEVVDHITAVHPSGRLEVSCRTEAPGGVVVEIRADGATRHDPDEGGRGLNAAARLAQRSRSGIVLRTPAPGHGAVSRGPLASIHCPGTVVKVDEPVYPMPLGEPGADAPGYGDLLAPSSGGRGIGSLEGGLGGLGDRPFSRILDELGSTSYRSPLPPAPEPGRPGYSDIEPGRPEPGRPEPGRPEPGRPGYRGAERTELIRPENDRAEFGRPGYNGPGYSGPEVGHSEVSQSELGNPEFSRPDNGRLDRGRSEPGRAEFGRPENGRPENGRPENGRPEPGLPEVGHSELGRPESGRPDNGRLDRGRSEPGRAEFGRPDNGRLEPGRSEPGRAEFGRPENGRPEPGRAETGDSEPGRPERGRPEPGRPDPGRPEPGRPDNGRPEPGRPENGRPENGRPENGRPEPGRAEPGHSEPGHSEPGHSEPGRAEIGRAEPGRSEPSRAELIRPENVSSEFGRPGHIGPENGSPENGRPEHGSFTEDALGLAGRPAPPLPSRRPDTRRPEPRRPDMRRPDMRRPDPLRPDQHRPDQHRPDQHRPDQHRPDQHRPEPRRPDPLSDPLPGLPAGSGPLVRGAADLDHPDLLGADPAQGPLGPADGAAGAPRRRSAWDSYSAGGTREPAVNGTAGPAAPPEPVDELFGPIVDLGPLSDDEADTPIFEAVASAWFRDETAPSPSPAPRRNGHSRPDPLDWESPGDPEWRAAAERAAQDDESPLTPGGLPRRRPGGRLVPPRAADDGVPPPVDRVPDRVRERLSGYQRGLRQGRHRAEPGQPADPGDPAAW